MKVVITGANGYIGSELVRHLVNLNYSVVALSRSSTPNDFVCLISGVTGTLRQHMKGADAVVHLAGQLVKDPNAPIEEYLDGNVVFTDTVMRSAVAEAVQIIVHASSRLVYPSTLTKPASELDAFPDTPYGLSKIWAENLVRHHSLKTGTSAVSLRIGQVTGGKHPGLGVISTFIRQASEDGVIEVIGSGQAQRHLIHLKDVVEAIREALYYRGKWRPINIAGPRSTTILEIAENVAHIVGVEHIGITHKHLLSEDVSCYALKQDEALKHLRWKSRIGITDIISEAWKNREKK